MTEYQIGSRTITVRKRTSHGRFPPLHGWTDWDLYESDRLLTTTDAWSEPDQDGPPTEAQVRAYLQPRRQRLQALMQKHKIVAGPDYQYEEVYEELYPDRDVDPDAECPRWLSVSRDETYHFFDLDVTFRGACNSLASRVGEDTGGVPVGIYDLESGGLVEIAVSTLVYPLDGVSADTSEDDTDLAVRRARLLVTAAENELESAVLARVRRLILREYPTATQLMYDGEENEMGLLHAYGREIRDGDGHVLDSSENPSDGWHELIDEDVEPLLWEVSERDQSYYGEGKTLDLV